jgi:hypothetical protein
MRAAEALIQVRTYSHSKTIEYSLSARFSETVMKEVDICEGNRRISRPSNRMQMSSLSSSLLAAFPIDTLK